MPRYFLNLNIGDFLRDTQNLSTLNKGAYVCLLMHYTARGKLPTDDEELRTISGMTAQQWRRNRAKLATFFDDQWRHKRVEGDIARQDYRSVQAKLNGRKGGQATQMMRRARVR